MSIEMTKEITLTLGESKNLRAEVTPGTVSAKNVSWDTTNSSVATVKGFVTAFGQPLGTVQAIKAGRATIRASVPKYIPGVHLTVAEVTDSCLVIVREEFKWTLPNKNVEQYKKDFVSNTFPKAWLAEPTTKVPAAVVTAQACLESDYGNTVPTDENTGQYSYNLFGIKGIGSAGRVLSRTREEDKNGNSYYIDDYFRAYNNYEESFIDHVAFLKENSRYDSLFESNDPIEWANGLQKAGYATANNYASTLIDVMNTWGLI